MHFTSAKTPPNGVPYPLRHSSFPLLRNSTAAPVAVHHFHNVWTSNEVLLSVPGRQYKYIHFLQTPQLHQVFVSSKSWANLNGFSVFPLKLPYHAVRSVPRAPRCLFAAACCKSKAHLCPRPSTPCQNPSGAPACIKSLGNW